MWNPSFRIQSSRWLRAWIAGLTLLVLVAIGSLMFASKSQESVVVGLFAVVYVLALGTAHWVTYARLQGPKAVLGIRYVEGGWQLLGGAGDWQDFEFVGFSALSPRCSILHFAAPSENGGWEPLQPFRPRLRFGFIGAWLERFRLNRLWLNRRVVVLLPDSASKEDLRRLRVFATFYRGSRRDSSVTNKLSAR